MSLSYTSKKTAPKKHYSRWRFYGHPMMPSKYLHQGYHILIPSIDCGDLEVLVKNLEVDADRILAGDLNPAACERAREYGVEATCGDILGVLEQALNDGKRIHTLNLDFCESPIKTASVLAIALRSNVNWIMYTFSQRSGKNLPTHAARRAWIIDECGQEPFEEWDYESSTKERKGSAMTCMIFRGSGCQPMSLYPVGAQPAATVDVPAPIDELITPNTSSSSYVSPSAVAAIQCAIRAGAGTPWDIYGRTMNLEISTIQVYLQKGKGRYWNRNSSGKYELIGPPKCEEKLSPGKKAWATRQRNLALKSQNSTSI